MGSNYLQINISWSNMIYPYIYIQCMHVYYQMTLKYEFVCRPNVCVYHIRMCIYICVCVFVRVHLCACVYVRVIACHSELEDSLP